MCGVFFLLAIIYGLFFGCFFLCFQNKQANGTAAWGDCSEEYLQCHLENTFWKVGMKKRDVLTQSLGGRTKIFETRVSVNNSMKLLEGIVLLVKV